MGKRFMALLVSFVLLCCSLPMVGMAATQEEKDALIEATKESYTKSQESANQEIFNGFCGRMTSHQLWNMGINPGLLTADGNKQYDLYSAMKKTNSGYYICSYSAQEYTLESALNAISHNGTKDVYNILVGFEWTNTEAGDIYGHAVVINGILDGKVYFVESFYTRLGGEEGNVVVCSIPEFVGIFEDWTLFEGVIHFAGKTYADACKEYPTDMFVRARFDMELRSQPCVVGQDRSAVLRSVAAGERLRVTGLLKNTYDEWYYRVEDGNQIGYLVADTVIPYRTNVEDLTLKNFSLEESRQDDLQVQGRIRAENGLVGTVEIAVVDQEGNTVCKTRQVVDAYQVNLKDFNEDLDFSSLQEGIYTVTVTADTAAAYISRGQLEYSHKTVLLQEQLLTVGDAEIPAQPKLAEETPKDGWVWQEGVWYRYQQGQPQRGWIREQGVWYYLQEDGAVTTGSEEIDGTTYYFSDTGAMCTGWYATSRGMRYLLEDGTVATGWQVIDGSRYYFTETGSMRKSGTLTDGNVRYRFQSDGRAVEVLDKKAKQK